MLAKNAESVLAGLGCQLIWQPRQPINSETEFAKASQCKALPMNLLQGDVRFTILDTGKSSKKFVLVLKYVQKSVDYILKLLPLLDNVSDFSHSDSVLKL